MKKARTTNPELVNAIRFLKKQSKENNVDIWKDIAERLAKPRRKRSAVNVSHLNKHTQKNETVVVPGKVLGAGEVNHQITVTAFSFSEKAKKKIKAAKGKCLSLSELIKKNPKGSNVRIIG